MKRTFICVMAASILLSAAGCVTPHGSNTAPYGAAPTNSIGYVADTHTGDTSKFIGSLTPEAEVGITPVETGTPDFGIPQPIKPSPAVIK